MQPHFCHWPQEIRLLPRTNDIFLHGRDFMTILNISGGSRISQGRQTQGGANLLFDIMFTENCTKMKQIELRRAAGSATES